MENKDWIKETFLRDKPVNFTSHPSYSNITPKKMKQKRTVLSNPKVSKEIAEKAKKAVLMFRADESYWKRNYTVGIDHCEIGGNNHATIVIFKDNRIVYHTKKLWKMKLLIIALKIFGIKILSENHENTN